MPDISQIVPLAALLSVSTDYLLGVGTNEYADKGELENKVKEVWATYSVNSTENNADLLVYELYKKYLNKYPLDYAVKVKCAFAIQDYLHVVRVRKKFDIPEERFDALWLECDRMLRSVCDNCTLPEVQIDAENHLIDLLLLKEMFEEAGGVAMKLPDLCGIRDKALCRIAQAKGDSATACEKQNLPPSTLCSTMQCLYSIVQKHFPIHPKQLKKRFYRLGMTLHARQKIWFGCMLIRLTLS